MPDNEQSGITQTQLEMAINGLHKQVKQFIKGDELTPGMVELAMKAVVGASEKGSQGAKVAVDLIAELVQNLTGVESFKIIPKLPFSLEVDIHRTNDTAVPVKMGVAPMVELTNLNLGRHIHFEALLDQQQNGLRITIRDGFSLVFSLPFVGFHRVDVKGSAILRHDEQRRLVVVFKTKVPGIDQEVDVAVPIKDILAQAKNL